MKPLFIHYCYNMLELSDMIFQRQDTIPKFEGSGILYTWS